MTDHRHSFLPTITLSTLLMGSSFPSAAVLLASGADALSLVTARFLVAALVAYLVSAVFISKTEPAIPLFHVALIGFFQTFGVMAPVHIALAVEPPAVVAAIVFSNVLMVSGVDCVVGKRGLSRTLAVSRILGVVGLILVTNIPSVLANREVDNTHYGVFLSVLAAVSWAVATLLSKRLNISGGWHFNAQQMIFGAALLAGVTLLLRGPTLWMPQTLSEGLWFFWLAIPASVISFGLWFRALSLRTATEASAWLAAVPAFAAAIAWFSIDSTLTVLQGGGMLCIVVALFLQSRTAIEP